MSKPIKPSDVVNAKKTATPDEVIDAFNGLIAEKFSSGSATVTVKEAADRIAHALGVSREQVFDRGWLDVEDIYRKAGWHVDFDKPGYNEDYEAYYVFSKRAR